MATKIEFRASNAIDAGITPTYFADRGYTVLNTSILDGVITVELTQDLTDEEKNALERDLRIDAGTFVSTDVSDAGETEIATKKRYMRVMDRCTETVIRRGFTFQADTFSLDTFAQIRGHRYWAIRASLTYPFAIPNIENTGGVQINDAAEMQDFFVAMHGALFTAEQDGISAKTTVRNAASKAAARTAAENYLTTNGCAHLIPLLGL